MFVYTTKPVTTRYCRNGESSHSSFLMYVALLCLTFQLASGLNSSDILDSKSENKAEKSSSSLDLDPQIINRTKELELKIDQDETLTIMMNQESKVRMNFTLYCSHPSIRYSIRLSTEDSNVAVVEGFRMFNVTCADVIFERQFKNNSLDSVPVVQGGFNFTLKADLIGRTWLYVLGERHADPGVVIPDFLILPWIKPKMINVQTSVTLSTNIKTDDGLVSSSASPDHDKIGHSVPNSHTSRDPNPSSDKQGDSKPGSRAPRDSASESVKPGDSNPSSNTPRDSNTPAEHPSYGVVPSDEDEVTEVVVELQKHVVTVMKKMRVVDITFRSVLYGFVILATVGMGCKTELSVVKDVLKKPIAPAIGFFCQYLLMPLIAFMLAKTLVIADPAVSLGIFACGICPGGGPSNMFSYLLDGDVSLSVTMTAISSVAALAMIPLWLFTLGTKFDDDKIKLNVPFARILMTLAIIIIPLFIGLAIKKWAPKVAKWILKVLKPFTLVAVLFMVTFGVYANLYVFRLFSARTLLAGCLLPYIGYLLGGIISFILRQPCYRIKTIAIETGIQNTSIAYLLLVFSLPTPDGDMAAVGPMASAIMTPLPLLVLVVVYLSYKRFCKKKKTKTGRAEYGEGKGEKGGEEAVALREEQGVKEENGHLEKQEDLADA